MMMLSKDIGFGGSLSAYNTTTHKTPNTNKYHSLQQTRGAY